MLTPGVIAALALSPKLERLIQEGLRVFLGVNARCTVGGKCNVFGNGLEVCWSIIEYLLNSPLRF